jgi:type 2A phosphatase activator TIP41
VEYNALAIHSSNTKHNTCQTMLSNNNNNNNNNRSKTFEYKDWKITSSTTPILNAQEIDDFMQRLQVFAMPEMIFNSNISFMYCPSGQNTFQLYFNALDALQYAKKDVLKEYQVSMVKVGCAWEEKMLPSSSTTAFLMQDSNQQQEKIEEREDNIDWTFTTVYKGSIVRNGQLLSEKEIQPKGSDKIVGIDFDRLKQQDDILFYDDILLYQDELHDHGESRLNVKARVMNYGFFCLLRFFLRVDGVCVRIMDSRLYHEFGREFIVREFTWYESSWSEIIRKNPMLVRDPAIMNDPQRLIPYLQLKGQQTRNISIQ